LKYPTRCKKISNGLEIYGERVSEKFLTSRKKISLRWEIYVPTVGKKFFTKENFLLTVGKLKALL